MINKKNKNKKNINFINGFYFPFIISIYNNNKLIVTDFILIQIY